MSEKTNEIQNEPQENENLQLNEPQQEIDAKNEDLSIDIPDEELHQNEDADFDAEQDAAESESSGLDRELEKIKTMFQMELDGQDASSYDEGFVSDDGMELIQPLDEDEIEETDAESEEIAEEDLCRCCGAKRRNKIDFGEDYPYCDECRLLMKKNPLNYMGVLVSLFIIVICGLGVGLMVSNIQDYETIADGEKMQSENMLSSALAAYNSYLSSVDRSQPYAKAAAKEFVKITAKTAYFQTSQSVAEQFFSQNELNLPWNKDVKDAKEYVSKLNVTNEKLQEIYGDGTDGDAFSESLDKLIEENKETHEFNQIFLLFNKLSFKVYNDGLDTQELIDELEEIEKYDKENFESENRWLYETYIMSEYASIGDIAKTQKYFDSAISTNKQDTDCYVVLADAYRFSLKADSKQKEIDSVVAKMEEIAQECAANFESGLGAAPSYNRIYVLSYLLKGQYDVASTTMDSYIQQAGSSVGLKDYNLLAACVALSGDKDYFNQIKDMLSQYGYSLEKEIINLQKGKGNVYNIIIDSRGIV